VLLVLLALAGCFEVVDLDPPPADAGLGSDATFDGDAGWPGDAGLDGGLPDAGL
jgi:hypothetical protein